MLNWPIPDWLRRKLVPSDITFVPVENVGSPESYAAVAVDPALLRPIAEAGIETSNEDTRSVDPHLRARQRIYARLENEKTMEMPWITCESGGAPGIMEGHHRIVIADQLRLPLQVWVPQSQVPALERWLGKAVDEPEEAAPLPPQDAPAFRREWRRTERERGPQGKAPGWEADGR